MSGAGASPEFEGFFAAAREGRLVFPRCTACGRFHWYPMPVCPHCRGDDWQWTPVSGAGEIFSYTVVRHAFDPARRERLPYVVAIVTFDEAPGVRLVTNIVDAAPGSLAIGQPVTPLFPPPGGDEPPVVFRVTGSARETLA